MSNSEVDTAKSISRMNAFLLSKDPKGFIDEQNEGYKSVGQQYLEWLKEENKKGNYL